MIEEIKIEQNEKWDKVVLSINNYEVFYLSTYVKAFQKMGDIPVLLWGHNDNENAIYVFYKRDISFDSHFSNLIPKNTYYDICSPYGYGGIISSSPLSKELVNEFYEFINSMGIVSEFVRFDLFSNFKDLYWGSRKFVSHNVVRELNSSLDEITQDFDRKVRKNLKKAMNSNLLLEIGKKEQNIEGFLKIYYDTMKRDNASSEYYFDKDFFMQLLDFNNSELFVVKLEEIIISAELVLFGDNNSYSFLGGTDSQYFEFRPNDFLKFGIIKWAKEKGLKTFVLGGGYGKDDGIFQYKKALAPSGIVDFYVGNCVFDKTKFDMLIDLRKKEPEFNVSDSFFPSYRINL